MIRNTPSSLRGYGNVFAVFLPSIPIALLESHLTRNIDFRLLVLSRRNLMMTPLLSQQQTLPTTLTGSATSGEITPDLA